MQRYQAQRRLERVADGLGSVLHGFRWVLLVALTAAAAGGVGFAIGYWLGT